MNARLVVIAGPSQGATYLLTDDGFKIGRDPRNELPAADSSVSREHCVIFREGDGFFIRDLDSHNGTKVNDLRVQQQPLKHGDYIAVGKTVLQFLTGEDIIFEDLPADDTVTVTLNHLSAQLAAADQGALLRVSSMLHSFHAMYRGRSSSVKSQLESYLLSLILDVIPANRGAILLYEETLDEPSSFSVDSQQAQPHRPVTISPKLVKRVLSEGCGLVVEGASQGAAAAPDTPPHSLLLAPLVIRGEACGLIYLEGHAFSESHLQLLVAVAQVASMAMENAFHVEWLEAENQRLEAELYPDHHMIGESALLRDLQRNIARAAQANATVLILGETGTGKELVARAIHQNSPRSGKPFVAVNCAALPETLLESELFGFEKGSFTGAVAQKKGKLELAEGGTVFLDEIGEVPLQIQVKLLRVLQERQLERVGGTQPVKLDIRLVAATNRNLEEEVRAGRFRPDLYYRLNVVTLKTPALRDRVSDIVPLAMHFAARFGQQCARRISGISPEAQAYLSQYEWPGNIRELENALERAVVLGTDDIIRLEDLPESIREISKPAAVSRTIPLQDAIDDAKRGAITRAFEQSRGDHTTAAKALGVHPNYLYRLMRNLGMR
jgi:transcriptional regulator with GAF, ATPase, and Fis domain